MLASPEPTAADVWERMEVARRSRSASAVEASAMPVIIRLEDKYDGIRCQLHKLGGASPSTLAT